MSAGTPQAKTRVMLVDDHETVRLGLAQVIGNEPRLEVCGQASDAPGALRLLRTVHPDMAIVDLSLREGNGLELIRQIKSAHPDVRMIVLSMHDEELYAERAVRAGAMGYVNKHAPAQTIISAIHAVSAGRLFLSDKMTSRMLTA
jgi:DNA-binding NarL/FixJ family response regulator